MSASVETRSIRIEPLSARTELLLVLRVSMAITVGVWLYVASSAGVGGEVAGRRNLLPFQKIVADRPPEEQRMFRELQEGLLEAEAARAANKSWPTVQTLSEEGIPPFAVDPTRRSRYRWQLLQGGTLVNYLGKPEGSGGPGWLLLVQEPEPGAPPDPAAEDEEHHKLASGPMLHVSTWVLPDSRSIGDRLVRLPQAEGWTQLYAVGPAEKGPAEKGTGILFGK